MNGHSGTLVTESLPLDDVPMPPASQHDEQLIDAREHIDPLIELGGEPARFATGD